LRSWEENIGMKGRQGLDWIHLSQ